MSTKYVDEVMTYNTESDLIDLLNHVKPDVRIIGSDWKNNSQNITYPDVCEIHWHERNHDWSSSVMCTELS